MDTLSYSPKVQDLVEAVLTSPGHCSPELRQTVEAVAATRWGARRMPTAALPEALRPYLEKVIFTAYKVTDKDIQRLIDAGYSEDELFELTVCAALGSGLARMEKTMELLGGGAT
ncbi:hypothetical protein [Candidatus Leptofilum sp.]|uniref:hypothetical protein n=1 Tax=Candidatus Leptofilum sp. TaxID=3241576 RepID=UPI003B5B2D54